MDRLGRKVAVASLGMLVVLGALCTLLASELIRWHEATAYVMRDYRRALLDGEFQEALTRAMAEKASYQLTGNEQFERESREALERAESTIVRSRALLQQEPQLPDDSFHAGLLERQASLLRRTEAALREVDEALKGGGIERSLVPLGGVYSTEVEADRLREETVAHHREERGENETALRRHGHRSLVLVVATVVVCTLWTVLVVLYVRRRIVTPITALSQLTARVAAGDLTQSAAVTHSDEIGRLQRSFNDMVVEVSLKQRELEASRVHLARSRDAAEAANRAKSEFLANVSHELRTPMNGVIVTLDLMHETAPNDEQRNLAELARASALGLLGMLNDLLDLSRIEAGKMELDLAPFEPRQLIDQMVELHGRRATAKGLKMSCEIADEVPARVTGDAVRLGQVLLNLLDNAIKFTERGSIHLKVSVEPPSSAPPPPEYEPPDAGAVLRFEVADTGIGIEPEAAPRLFQPFYQAASGLAVRKYGGIGLGLGIARQLARMMDGDLGFRSEPGRGSTFWFTARLRVDSTGDAASAPTALPHRYDEGAAVLLVEDNRDNREVMARVLARRGLRVGVAEDGRQAVELAASQNFDLIFMDCQMPEMDGFAATRAIRQMGGTRGRVPIVALTAYGVAGTQRYFNAGFDDLVAKPYTIQEIDAALYRWLVVARAGGGRPGPQGGAGPAPA